MYCRREKNVSPLFFFFSVAGSGGRDGPAYWLAGGEGAGRQRDCRPFCRGNVEKIIPSGEIFGQGRRERCWVRILDGHCFDGQEFSCGEKRVNPEGSGRLREGGGGESKG